MRFIMITAVSAFAITLAGCGEKASQPADTGTNMTATDTSTTMPTPAATMTGGQTFANAAAKSDAFEIASSKLALDKSTSSDIKKFAQKMVDAHTDSTAKLMTAASGATPAIVPDSTLTPDQQSKIDDMQGKSGTDFDQAYVAAQTEGHQKTLDTLRDYSANGDVPELKAFATTVTPIVAAHLNMAKSLKA